MKHDALIAPDESQFAFTPKISGFAASNGVTDTITVPDAELLFQGTFKRDGDDLKIIGKDGNAFLVDDYFAHDKKPALLSPEGASLSSAVVESLAGPLAAGQYAQAGAPQSAGQAIGRVEKAEGNATVVRNGVTITLNTGDVIQKGDVAQTGAGGSLAIVFADGTAFNLAANARMVLNDFVYSAGGSNNSALISLVQGSISFVAGQVAKTGDMRVDTPVATMGIRGTAVLVEISANNGQTKFSVMVEPNGVTGSFNLYNKTTGALIGTVNSSTIGWVVTPAGPLEIVAQQVQKTPAELARELAIMQQVFNTFNAGPFDPNAPQQQPTDPQRRGDNPQAPGSPGSPGGTQIDSIKFTELTPPATGGNNTNTNTSNPSNGPTDPGNSGPGGDGPGGAPGEPTQQTVLVNTVTGGTGSETFGPAETGPYDFYTTEDDDHVFAGGGDDDMTAGHGGGNDIYDGGEGGEEDGDTIRFTSADGVTFQLNSFFEGGVWKSRAFSPTTDSDIFFNIENIVGSPGDDVFVVHHLDGDLNIDAGEGFDIVKLLDGVDVGANDGFEVTNFEMVDLTNVTRNVVEFEGGGIDENTPCGELRIVGDSQDVVKLTPGGENGHWEFIWRGRTTDADLFGDDDHYSDGVTFDEYVFISDEPGDFEGEVLATLYIDKDVSVVVSAPDALVEQGSGVDGTSESTVKLTTGSPYYDLTGWGLAGTANFQEFGGHYYEYVHQVNWWWNNARDAALFGGGYLANLTSEAESNFVSELVGGNPYAYVTFIGASDATNEGTFVWVDGPEAGQNVNATFTFWAPGEPNNAFGNENYLAMVSGPGDNEGGRWNDVVNSYSLANGYLVEYPSDVTFANVGIYGYITLDTETNELTYHLNNSDADTQALTAGQTVIDSFDVVVFGSGDTRITHHVEFTIHGSNDAPEVDSHDAKVGYTLGSPGVAVDGLITLSDVDSAILHGATITIEDFTDGDTLIFASVGNISGSFDSNTGVLTLTGNDTIAAYQLALRSISYQNIDPDASTGDRTVTFQVNDGAVASNVATSTVHVDDDGGEETPNIAPVINIDDVTTTDDPDSTTVLGLSVSDADRVEGDIYTVTATALHGTLSASQGNPQSSIEFSEAFAGLNNKLAQGITYFDPAEPEQGATVNDKVTLTVTDADNNSDTINFIFNVYGEGGATLEGTSGKDILFSTGGADTLTGDINDAHSADTFVFDHDVSCEGIGADIIADFTVGQDKIALANFGYDDASQFGMAYNADLDALIITLAEGETISLDHVTQLLTNDSFIFHS